MRYEKLIEKLNNAPIISYIINDLNVNYIKEDTSINKIVIQCWGEDGFKKIQERTQNMPGFIGVVHTREYERESEIGSYKLRDVTFTYGDIKIIISDVIE